MSKFLIALLTVFCFNTIAAELASHNMTQEVLLDKIEKAADPKGVCKTWKTLIMKMKMSVPMQKIEISTTIMAKFPDKTKTIANVPGMTKVIEVLNGNKSWTETVGLGIQMKSGRQLAFAKFKAKRANPTLKLTEIYEKVTLDPALYQFGKYKCYKLICSTPKELKIKPEEFYIDNKEFLPRWHISSEFSEMGVIPVKSEFLKYKTFKGAKIPMLVNNHMMGIKMIVEIISVTPNAKIADSEFALPKDK